MCTITGHATGSVSSWQMKMAEVIRGASHPMGAVDALVSPHGCVRLSAAGIDTQMHRQILDNRIQCHRCSTLAQP
jgi:hypothetical protein